MIKQYILQFVFLFAVSFIAVQNISRAQSIVIIDTKSGNEITGQTITLTDADLNNTHEVHLDAKNISGNTLNIKVKRYETSVLMNTQNFFCWSVCYTPTDAGVKPVWTDNGFVAMVPDSVYEKFKAYYIANGNSGASSFRYVFFDVNNTSDSAFVDIVFDISVGMDENSINRNQFYLYPNPSNEIVNFEWNNKLNQTDKLEIYSAIGEKIESISMNNPTGKFKLNTADYNSGLYFIILKENGIIKSSKKFLVSN